MSLGICRIMQAMASLPGAITDFEIQEEDGPVAIMIEQQESEFPQPSRNPTNKSQISSERESTGTTGEPSEEECRKILLGKNSQPSYHRICDQYVA